MSDLISRIALGVGRPFMRASRGAADVHYRALAWLLNKPATTSAYYHRGTLRFTTENDEFQELLEYLSDRTLGKLALVVAMLPFFAWPEVFGLLGQGFAHYPQPFGFILALPVFVFAFLTMAGSVLRAATLRLEVSD
jgi:hypothetical protein